MSKQLFKQLFLGERGQTLTDTACVTDEKTPYTVYHEQSLHVVSDNVKQSSERLSDRITVKPVRPTVMEPVTHDEPSLGF